MRTGRWPADFQTYASFKESESQCLFSAACSHQEKDYKRGSSGLKGSPHSLSRILQTAKQNPGRV